MLQQLFNVIGCLVYGWFGKIATNIIILGAF
jgi:hypothetical protein